MKNAPSRSLVSVTSALAVGAVEALDDLANVAGRLAVIESALDGIAGTCARGDSVDPLVPAELARMVWQVRRDMGAHIEALEADRSARA
jgi:hypothetical protein